MNRSHSLSIVQQCVLLALSRSTVYYSPRGESKENQQLMKEIKRIYMERPASGSRTIKSRLAAQGHTVARCRVARLMRLQNLRAIYPKKRRTCPARLDATCLRRQAVGKPVGIACDRWRLPELKDSMAEAGLMVPIDDRGQGYRDGAADVWTFRNAIEGSKVTPVRSVFLTSCMSETRTISDPAGNRKLAKAGEGKRGTMRPLLLSSPCRWGCAGNRSSRGA